MAMYQKAQLTKQADEELVVALPTLSSEPAEEVVFYHDQPSLEEVVEMHAPANGEIELSFKLPVLPGCPDEMVVSTDEIEVKHEDEKKEEKDKSKAADQPKDLNWIKNYLDNIPKHHGETIGLERAKSYLQRGSNFLSKILQEDYDGKIDISKAEDARVEIENGVERLEKELQKRKKKASANSGDITKEAQKLPSVGGIIITVPLKISRIARTCINGSISGGKDIEHLVKEQSEKWKLSEDEQADLVQLIQDMGFYMRRDRGFKINDKNPYSYNSENNFDLPPNYHA